MTDKEILIKVREKVEKLKKDLPKNRGYKRNAYNHVLSIIDSMQEEPKQGMYSKDNYTEEPVSEVWHDAQTEKPQAKEKILATNEYGDCEVDFAINMALYWPKVIKWAYIEDLLNLSNVQRTVKICKEPVSEGLEEAADNALSNVLNTHKIVNVRSCLEMFRLGAKWQKQKDNNNANHALVEQIKTQQMCYEKGIADMRQQMMAKAIDGDITFDYYGDDDKTYGCIAHDSFCLEDFGLKDRDKVKILILKKNKEL